MWWIWITAAVIGLDQLTKYFASAYLAPIGFSDFIPHFLSFRYVLNPGAAWGMLSSHPWIFMTLSTVAIIGVIIFFFVYKNRHPLLTVSLALILGGGIGNMIDRILFGEVVDFLHFEFISFPTFNIADCGVTIGGSLLIAWFIFIDFPAERKKNNEKKQNSAGDDHA